MKYLSLIVAIGFLPFLARADAIHWGQPVNGVRLGVECAELAARSDQNLGFKVTVQNVSDHPITLPAPGSFVPLTSPQSEDYHASPLTPLVEKTRTGTFSDAAESSWSMGESGIPVNQAPRGVVELAPGESRTWESVPLEKYFYYGDRLRSNNRTTVQKWCLLPGYVFHIAFRFENERRRLTGRNLWTGRSDSGVVDVAINPPSTDGIKLDGSFSLSKNIYFLGEPIETTFTVRNTGDAPFDFPAGSDYRGSGRHDRFSIHAVDDQGQAVPDPVPPSGMGGGLGGHIRVSPKKPYTEKLLINQWCAFPKAGRFKITCRRTLGILRADLSGPDSYSIPETSLPTIPIEATFEITIEENPSALAAYIGGLIPVPVEKGELSNEAAEQLRSLAQARVPAAFPEIVKLLDGPPILQLLAVQWLASYDSEKASPVLLDRNSKLAPWARQAALRALSEWNTPGVEPLLVAALHDQNSELRANTVLLCSRRWYATCVPILLTMGNDPDPLVRRYLGSALGVCGDKRAIPVLIKLLHDTKDPFISIWAAQGLGKWKRLEGVPVMIDLLRNPKARGDEGNILEILHDLTGKTFNTRQSCLAWWEKSAPEDLKNGKTMHRP